MTSEATKDTAAKADPPIRRRPWFREVPNLAAVLIVLSVVALFVALIRDGEAPDTVMVWRHYRALPGKEQQFVALFMKNTYRVLEDQQALGQISGLHVYRYTGNVAGPGEWTLTVSMRYLKAAGSVPSPSAEAIRRLFADQGTYELEKLAESQLVDAQWDVFPEDLDRTK